MNTLRQENKSLYWAWKAMKQRCNNPKCYAYKNYGDRGIKVCDEWSSFEPFYEWAIANGHEAGLDLDRIDNDGDYSPGNCRWASRKDNVNNRRKTLNLTVNGDTKPRTEWERIAGIRRGTVKSWITKHGSEYAASRVADAIANGYKECDYGYSHRKSVVHCETGTVFKSVKDAADAFGIAPCTISNAMRSDRPTGHGRFVWEEVATEKH